MVTSMKEHKAGITYLNVSADDKECVSACGDGSCIIWSLERYVRNNCLFASTKFRAVLYHPDQSQFLTTGTDRKVCVMCVCVCVMCVCVLSDVCVMCDVCVCVCVLLIKMTMMIFVLRFVIF